MANIEYQEYEGGLRDIRTTISVNGIDITDLTGFTISHCWVFLDEQDNPVSFIETPAVIINNGTTQEAQFIIPAGFFIGKVGKGERHTKLTTVAGTIPADKIVDFEVIKAPCS